MTTVKKGATDQTFYFKLVDSAAGTPETGLTITNIDATYVRNRAAAVKNDLTALAAADSAHADNKGIEVDSTNAPGLYRIDFPDAAFATGVDKVILAVTCSGCDPAMKEIELVDNEVVDVYSRIGAPVGASISADIAGVQSDTNDIQTRLPAALVSGRIDASVGAMAANVITAAATAADFTTEVTSGLSTLDAAGVRSAVGLASANLDTQLTAIDDFLDTEVAAIKAKTDQLTFTAANKVDANILAISGSTTAADNLEGGGLGLVVSTCASGSTTTSIVTNLTEATDNHYNGRVITFTSGALLGQTTSISDYNGTTKTLTVVELTEAPSNTDGFVIS